jgi:putrescine transport system ATP-binding protein
VDPHQDRILSAPVAAAPPDTKPPVSESRAEPIIRLEGVSKSFDSVRVVQEVDLAVERGEFFSLLGASGCGKTTLLRLLAGFETPDSGRIAIAGADMAGVPPYRRPVNMMFQSYALFPHMTVADNVAFGLKQERLPREEIRRRTREMLELVQMTGYERRKPDELSGGQRQRVALARAIVRQPELLLLDEPLAALDRKLREETRLELVAIQARVGITFVMVTHDQEEAMTMSTRIAVMKEGRIEQIGSPRAIYEYPGSRFVADFIGSANIFEGVIADAAGRLAVAALGLALDTGQGSGLAPGTAAALMIRPEKLSVTRERPPQAGNLLEGVVRDIAYLGNLSIYRVDVGATQPVQAALANLSHGSAAGIGSGDRVFLSWHPADAVLLTR